MLGGGTWITQNKQIPGVYINVVSKSRATAEMADRGVAAMALELDWGGEAIVRVDAEDFFRNSEKLFGYPYTHEKLWQLRELFLGAKTVYVKRLNLTGAKKARNEYAEAKYLGVRGNNLSVRVAPDAEVEGGFVVSTYLEGRRVDVQRVTKAAELKDNDYVVFTKAAELKASAGLPLAGGSNGTVDGAAHQAFLTELETYSFNTLGCSATDEVTKKLYRQYTIRLNEDVGAKFQLVVAGLFDSDHECVIGVGNSPELVYWVTGQTAGCAINKTLTAKKYDGERAVPCKETQAELIASKREGKFLFHRVGDEIQVLQDVNTFTSHTDEKNENFQFNQVVRVVHQECVDIANVFAKKYLGKVPNDADGRVSLWADIVKLNQEYERLRAIQNFDEQLVKVEQGESKRAVVANLPITPTMAMEQLYLAIVVV